ncbi:MAG: CPBP family intramembrane metalloprotease [Candidatus Bathyarchaeum sp.]|nr:MAG: CPBP family intramembrane metalloprotease [Candidatus Bathyarchaeum sp.]
MSEQSFIKRHSALIYFVLAFSISWIGVYAVIEQKFWASSVIEISDLGIMAIAQLNGPFFAGILMTLLVNGKLGIKQLFSRMKKYKVAGRWYLPVLIFPGLLLAVSLLLGILVSPELAPTFGVFGLIGGPMAGLLEETGWMGFAYPKMKGKRSALGTAIYFGVFHGIWHIVADFLGNFNAFGGYWLPYFFGFCLHVVALRVLIVWVYENTGSVFLSILMHVSSTGFYGLLISTTMAPVNWVIFYNVYGVALCLVALIVALKYGKSLKIKYS